MQTVYFSVARLPGLLSVRGGERRRHRLAVAFTRIAQYHAQHPATACLAPKLLNRCSSAEKECRSVPTCCRAACVKSARPNHGARRRRVGEPLLVGPVSIAEDPVKCFRVSLLNPTQCRLQNRSDISCYGPHIAPMTIRRDLKSKVLGELCILLVAARFVESCLIFLVVNIRDALEKVQQRERHTIHTCRSSPAHSDPRRLPKPVCP